MNPITQLRYCLSQLSSKVAAVGGAPRVTSFEALVGALSVGDAVVEGITLTVPASGVTVPTGRTLWLEEGATIKVSSYVWSVTGSAITLGAGASIQSSDGTGIIDGDSDTHRTAREVYEAVPGQTAARQYGITAAADSIVRGITIKDGFNEAIFGGAAHRTKVQGVTVIGGGKGPLFTQSDDLVITDLIWRDGLCNHTLIYPHGLTLYSCTGGVVDGYSVVNMGATAPAPSYLISLFNMFSCSSMRVSNYYCGDHNSGTDHPPFGLAEDGGNGNVYSNLVMTHMRGGSGIEIAGRDITISNFILDYTQGMVGSPYDETGFLLIGTGVQAEIGILTEETQLRSKSGVTNAHIANGKVIGCDRPFDIRSATGLVVNSVKFIGSVLTGPRITMLKAGADYGWTAGLEPVCDDIEFVNCSSYYGAIGFTWAGGNNIRYRNCRAIGCSFGIGNYNNATKRVGELLPVDAITADAGGTSTQIVHTGLALALLGATDWTHVDLTFYTGSRSWEVRRVASYDSGTKTITLATALSGAPTAGDLFNLHMPHGLVTIEGGEYRDAEVWADIPAGISYNGSAGNFVSGTEYQFTSPYCERLMVGQKIVIRGILFGAADLNVVVSRVDPLNNDIFYATASATGTLGSLTAGAGTISSSGRTVTGVGTNFNTYQKQVYIKAGGEWRRVVRQDSTLVWTIDTPFTTPLSGATWEVAIYNLGQATISGGGDYRIRLSRYFGNVVTRNTSDPVTEVFVTPGSVLANLRSNPGTGAIANLKETTTGNLVTQSFPSAAVWSQVSTNANYQFTPLAWTKFDGNLAAGLSTTPTARMHAAVADTSIAFRAERTGATLASLDLDFRSGNSNFTVAPSGHVVFGDSIAAGNKNFRLSMNHHTSATPFGLIYGSAQTSNNSIAIGGGTSQANAATAVGFYTAANNVTTSGTEVMRLDKADSATQTAMLLMHNGTLKRVEVGAVDSGGAGFRSLRIPN